MARSRTKNAAAGSGLFPDADPIDGLGWGLRIHRCAAPRDWPRELEKVPEEFRAGAEEYLRGIAARMRVVRRLKGNHDGPPGES